MVKSYPRAVEDSVVSFAVAFMQEAVSSLHDDYLFFVVLDNLSLADAASWNLFQSVSDNLEHLILLLCIQSEGSDYRVSEHAKRFYQ